MADIAKFITVSPGTRWRPNSESNWTEASAQDPLRENYESDNINDTDYEVELNAEAEIHFNDGVTVELNGIKGDVWYRTPDGSAKAITRCTLYDIEGVATKPGGSVSVTCSAKGGYRPPAWNLYR